MNRRTERSPLRRLDVLLRHVGEWLLVGYTVAMVLVTFVVPERRGDPEEHPSTSSARATSGSCPDDGTGRVLGTGGEAGDHGSEGWRHDARRPSSPARVPLH